MFTKQADKIRVAVLYGGCSVEHEVSLQSAANVIQYLDQNRFDIVPIGIDKKGNWFLGQDVFKKSLENNKVMQLPEINATWFTPEWIGKTALQSLPAETLPATPSTSSSTQQFDVVFPVVHGTSCEDGTLQGLLELAGIPYVGCGVLSSAIGMDKDISKRLAINAGIKVAPYLVIKHGQWLHHPSHFIETVSKDLAYPVFVKPANTGSSVGITKVKSRADLTAAIDIAFQFDTKVLVEKALSVMELEVAVLESLETNDDPIVSVVGEIVPKHEFYSYDAKYVDEHGAELHIPAPLLDAVTRQAQETAKKLFHILECEGMARVDLFFDKDNKEIVFNEINTIPGFTQISMYPKLMCASGMSYSDLLTHLVQLAIKRHKNKSKLLRNYG